MDNLTHSIAGILLAEALWQARSLRGMPPPTALRTRLFTASVIGNNLPDLDFLYAKITPGKLGYLLHHRGHTHTLVAGLLSAALLYLAVRSIGSARKTLRPSDTRWLLLACIASPQLHVAMDFCNNYGVHPFWPLNDAWYYGDAIFIVEPWFWVVALPPLIFAARTRIFAIGLGVVLLAALIAAWIVDFVPPSVSLSLSLTAALLTWISARLPNTRRILLGVASSLGVALAFFAASRSAHAKVLAVSGPHHAVRPRTLEDVVLTPAVANPLCVSALIVESDADRYFVSTATVSSAPWLMNVEDCVFPPSLPSTRLTRVGGGGGAGAVRLQAEWSAPLSELRALARENCVVEALLRFTRVPVFLRADRGNWYVGDLRYDREPALGFAELLIPARPLACPHYVPSWRPPRWRLLGAPP